MVTEKPTQEDITVLHGPSSSHSPMKDLFAQFETTPLDEVLPQPVVVTWVEYVEQDAMDEDGNVILDPDTGTPERIRLPRNRKSTISTYVPMDILHGMIASQDKLKQIQALSRQAAQNGGVLPKGEQGDVIEWLLDQVVAVWKLTEPKMTKQKLAQGLSFQKTFKLFNVFFGDLLQQLSGLGSR